MTRCKIRCPSCKNDLCSCYLEKMALVAQVVPYRFPFGKLSSASVAPNDQAYVSKAKEGDECSIRFVTLSSETTPLSIGISNTAGRVDRRTYLLPVRLLLNPREDLIIWNPTPGIITVDIFEDVY